ncbi:MAG: tetratricopeptide repeat protein [Candidatus Nitrospinota bacterium M3_3B_026]
MSAAPLALAAAMISIAFVGPAYLANKEGNKLYAAGRYKEALAEYRRAGMADPESETVKYNMGNTLYRLKRYEEAAQAYSSVVSSGDGGLEGMAAFNRGGALYRAGEAAQAQGNPDGALKFFEAAAGQYKNLLKEYPSDNDARHNLELALEKIRELEKQRKERDREDNKTKGGGQQEKKAGKEEKEPTGGEDGAGEEGRDERRENENRLAKEDRGNKQEQKKRDKPQSDRAVEQASRVFRAVEQDERALREKLRLKALGEAPQKEKDW